MDTLFGKYDLIVSADINGSTQLAHRVITDSNHVILSGSESSDANDNYIHIPYYGLSDKAV